LLVLLSIQAFFKARQISRKETEEMQAKTMLEERLEHPEVLEQLDDS
jgi:hypothetical protein